MFLTIIPYILDISHFMIISLAGWTIFMIVLSGCILIKKGEQMEQYEGVISPERKVDE